MKSTKPYETSPSTAIGMPSTSLCQYLMTVLVSSILMVIHFITPILAFGIEKEGIGQPHQSNVVHPTAPHWSYHGFQGPRFWGFLEEANQECRIGHQQSPIDVIMPHHPDHQEKLGFQYSHTQVKPVLTTHGIQFRPSGQSRLQFNNRTYQLQQFHFHDPSEHHIQGQEFPLEMHLVHEDQSGHLLVIALLFTQGTANEELAPILRLGTQFRHSRTVQHDQEDNRLLETSDLNIQHLLPDNLHHFSYQGSLTTPPCTQGVQWIIIRTPVQLLPSQLETLKTLYGVNARPVQPLHNREIQNY